MTTNRFLSAYLEAAEFTECHSDNPEMQDANGWSDELLKQAEQDCAAFQEENADDLDAVGDDAASGHDFWLTRNGHGAGFWARDLGAVGDRLTHSADSVGEYLLYVGDDGLIYGM